MLWLWSRRRRNWKRTWGGFGDQLTINIQQHFSTYTNNLPIVSSCFGNQFSLSTRHFFLKLKAQNIEYDDPENFTKALTGFGAKLDAPLIEQFADEFSTDLVIKNKPVTRIALLDVCDYYLSRHPTELPPVKKSKSKKKKKKDKKKDKKNDKKGTNVK